MPRAGRPGGMLPGFGRGPPLTRRGRRGWRSGGCPPPGGGASLRGPAGRWPGGAGALPRGRGGAPEPTPKGLLPTRGDRGPAGLRTRRGARLPGRPGRGRALLRPGGRDGTGHGTRRRPGAGRRRAPLRRWRAGCGMPPGGAGGRTAGAAGAGAGRSPSRDCRPGCRGGGRSARAGTSRCSGPPVPARAGRPRRGPTAAGAAGRRRFRGRGPAGRGPAPRRRGAAVAGPLGAHRGADDARTRRRCRRRSWSREACARPGPPRSRTRTSRTRRDPELA